MIMSTKLLPATASGTTTAPRITDCFLNPPSPGPRQPIAGSSAAVAAGHEEAAAGQEVAVHAARRRRRPQEPPSDGHRPRRRDGTAAGPRPRRQPRGTAKASGCSGAHATLNAERQAGPGLLSPGGMLCNDRSAATDGSALRTTGRSPTAIATTTPALLRPRQCTARIDGAPFLPAMRTAMVKRPTKLHEVDFEQLH